VHDGGKVALVTGGSRGIGRAIAERLGSQAYSVIVNYHSHDAAAKEVVGTIQAAGGRAVAVQADVADPAQLRGLFDAAEEHYGGLDILVHNVGVARFSSIGEASDEDYELMFATNTTSTFVALREAANRLHDGGRIVVISSGVTVTTALYSGVYAASKAAGEQLVRSLAKEIGSRGITVNAVRPGLTRTEALTAGRDNGFLDQMVAMTPLGRLGEPADIADVVAFLVSEEGGWVTGQAVNAGGGLF